jgi:hypothetical protein
MIEALVNLLFGCHHRRTTRPITPVRRHGDDGGDTYVACLGCGKRLHYDLETMRIGKPIAVTGDSTAVNPFQTSYK